MVRRSLFLLLVLLCSLPMSCVADSLEGASWQMEASGPVANGINALSGADGITEVATRGAVNCLTLKPNTNSLYMYFSIDDSRTRDAQKPVYVVIDYFDEALGPGMELEYDSATGDDLAAKYRPAEAQAGGFLMATNTWRKTVFLLKQPRFNHGENLNADFRVKCRRLFVRSVQLTYTRPADYEQIDKIDTSALAVMTHIGPGGQLIIGGFDPERASDVPTQTHALEAAMPAFHKLGATSSETYVRWNLCEVAPGKFDWSVYDQYVAVLKRHNLKWVPFLICGSAYSLPDWYYKKPGSQGYVCLEHGIESDVQSLWNPALRQHVATFIQAFCAHYAPTGVIESVLLGVTGNYGEAIYPASGNDWTSHIHGQYHTHTGYWAGDPYAIASFRSWLTNKYQTDDRIRSAWGKASVDLTTVLPFTHPKRPGERAWLDFVDWYTGSMTDYAAFWLKTTRDAYPSGDIYLCTGGDAPPEHGANFGDQAKVAAQFHAGVRITNEGSDFGTNFAITRWVGSATRQYGGYSSFEPASAVDPEGIVARIFNATTQGARGLHFYNTNLFDNQKAEDYFIQYAAQFQQRQPLEDIAVYYPETWIKLVGQYFDNLIPPLRDRFDFDYRSDSQIRDGGLKSVKALILLKGNIAENETWNAIADWVRQGGLLFYADGIGTLQTPEGDTAPNQLLLGKTSPLGAGRILIFHGDNTAIDYRNFITDALRRAPELSFESRAMVISDGQEDHVYVTIADPNDLLWLNYSANTVTCNGIPLEPYSIRVLPITRKP